MRASQRRAVRSSDPVASRRPSGYRPLVAVQGEQAVVQAASAEVPVEGAQVFGHAPQPLPGPLGVVGGPGGVGQQGVADRQGLALGGAAELDLAQRLVGVPAGGGLGGGLGVGAALLADGGVALAEGLAVGPGDAGGPGRRDAHDGGQEGRHGGTAPRPLDGPLQPGDRPGLDRLAP